MQNNFKCIRTPSGRYTLYMTTPYGRLRRVRGIGRGAQPFQIVATFPGTEYVAIRRTALTPRGPESKLYLVNTKTGEMPPMIKNGTEKIAYNAVTNRFYYSDTRGPDDTAKLAQTLMHLNGVAPRLHTASAQTNGTPIMVIMRKRRRTRPRIKKPVQKLAQKQVQKPAKKPALRPLPDRGATRPAISAQMVVPYPLNAPIISRPDIAAMFPRHQNLTALCNIATQAQARTQAQFQMLLQQKLAMMRQK